MLLTQSDCKSRDFMFHIFHNLCSFFLFTAKMQISSVAVKCLHMYAPVWRPQMHKITITKNKYLAKTNASAYATVIVVDCRQ